MLSKQILLYYLSEKVTDLSPPLDSMSSVMANSPSEAVEILARDGRLPPSGAHNWAHFLAAMDEGGALRGFHSVRLEGLESKPKV